MLSDLENEIKARNGKLVDVLLTDQGDQVLLYQLPTTYVTIFPDGKTEYTNSIDGWRDEMEWRYHQVQTCVA